MTTPLVTLHNKLIGRFLKPSYHFHFLNEETEKNYVHVFICGNLLINILKVYYILCYNIILVPSPFY